MGEGDALPGRRPAAPLTLHEAGVGEEVGQAAGDHVAVGCDDAHAGGERLLRVAAAGGGAHTQEADVHLPAVAALQEAEVPNLVEVEPEGRGAGGEGGCRRGVKGRVASRRGPEGGKPGGGGEAQRACQGPKAAAHTHSLPSKPRMMGSFATPGSLMGGGGGEVSPPPTNGGGLGVAAGGGLGMMTGGGGLGTGVGGGGLD